MKSEMKVDKTKKGKNWINFTHRCLRWCPLYVVSSWPPAEREIKWNAFFCRSLSYEWMLYVMYIHFGLVNFCDDMLLSLVVKNDILDSYDVS